ncbi:putative glycosyltransferase YkcC [Geobacter sp. OR-1]|uniref:glycosyltransferase family 2 protein n=1 Tax=Geobacter sp. OR-1 TaxID=1266765 RepID=UPI0005437BDC|nr:glycosyltransferase family 2 protein [Geobacter sp. OR-1]GAM08955.1 putative glycosyltransferase YkcC [Geobacter sp. OR-1]
MNCEGKKLISIVTPCYNEEDNVAELYRQVQEVLASLPEYRFEHIFIDNASKDRTVAILKEIAATDRNVKIIVNSRNFGHLRSPVHGILQASGDAVILLVADLQDPPPMIRAFVRKWEEGFKVVLGVKTNSEETPAMFMIRKMYYNLIGRLSDIELTKNNTGFGLYDRCIVESLRRIDDPYPYFRGMVSEIGFEKATIEYLQPVRKRGITKNNFYTLYDTAMLGITNHSRVPLRMATMIGFAMSALSLLVSIGYLAAKMIFWERFSAGMAPVVIGLFFFSSVQLFFIGILGEYIGLIYTQVQKRPLVIEQERVNFDVKQG